jgi:glycosyltransferase involved in cell wall biosynthesis
LRKFLTLVIAVYNASRYLEFIFAALQRQSFQDFEVIIADDGSGPEIAELVERAQRSARGPIKHIWQPDHGFRKNAILNRAIETSETDYLVFIDGDCVPHREFLRDHWENREDHAVLSGYRVTLSERMTRKLTVEDISSGSLDKIRLRLLWDGFRRRSSTLEEGIRIKNRLLRHLIVPTDSRLLGSNFSLQKKLLEKVNGFNEDYQAPGLGEDSDIAYRLKLIGARFVNLRYLAILYHLYHPLTRVGETNKLLFQRTVESNSPICKNGLRKLS